jgi:hypothetical protein
MSHYIRHFMWDELTAMTVNGKLKIGCGREQVRAEDVMGDLSRRYWPMDLVRSFVRENYARWLVEQPEWFTPEWIALIPPEFLEDLDLTVIIPVTDASSKQEITFRQSATAKPWCLGAGEMARWLEDNWLVHEGISHPDRARDLVQQLSEASGVELLARCAQPASSPPFARIAQTRMGEKIWDSQRLEELTSFLQTRAGLTFYYQLYCVSNSVSPLLDLEWVSLLEHDENTEGSIVRSRDDPSQLYTIKFGRDDENRRNEEKLHRRVADSEFVASTLHYHGTLLHLRMLSSSSAMSSQAR